MMPRAKKDKVMVETDRLKVYLTAPPVEGQANSALVELLAEHFKVKRSQVKIIAGEKGRDKVVEICG